MGDDSIDSIMKKRDFMIQVLYFVLVGLLVLGGLFFIYTYLLSFVISLFLVMIVHRIIGFINKYFKISSNWLRVVVALILYCFFALLLGCVGYYLFHEALYYVSVFFYQMKELKGSNFLVEYVLSNQSVIMNKCFSILQNMMSLMPRRLFDLFFIILSSLFLVYDFSYFKQQSLKILGDKHNYICKLVDNMETTILIYVRVYTRVFFFVFIELFVSFQLLDMDAAFLYAFLLAIIDMLPVIGLEIVMYPWIGFCFLQGDSKMLIPLFIIYGIVFFTKQYIETKYMSKFCAIHPLYFLISMYLCFTFFGLFGMLLSPFLCIIIKEIIGGKRYG